MQWGGSLPSCNISLLDDFQQTSLSNFNDHWILQGKNWHHQPFEIWDSECRQFKCYCCWFLRQRRYGISWTVISGRVLQFLKERHVWSACSCWLWFIGQQSLGWSYSTWPAKVQVIYQASSSCLLKYIKCFVLFFPVFLFLQLQTRLQVKKEGEEWKDRKEFAVSHYPLPPDRLRKAGSSNNEHDAFVP